jgi:hypothetical protein
LKIKRLQQFISRTTGQVVKVTKVTRPDVISRKTDLCRITDVVDGKLKPKTARLILADSLRRRYIKV